MDKTRPKVSVLIPAYNAERFIRRTIASALNQTFTDLEVIIVDDGSKDRTREIVIALQRQEPRIRYFHQENRGLADTRNRLIELAAGEFVAFWTMTMNGCPNQAESVSRTTTAGTG